MRAGPRIPDSQFKSTQIYIVQLACVSLLSTDADLWESEMKTRQDGKGVLAGLATLFSVW